MTVKNTVTAENGTQFLWVAPEDGEIPGRQAGQFLAISLPDVSGIGPTMVTVHIDEESTTELRPRVPKNGERATDFLYECINVYSALYIGVAVGKPKPTTKDDSSDED